MCQYTLVMLHGVSSVRFSHCPYSRVCVSGEILQPIHIENIDDNVQAQ